MSLIAGNFKAGIFAAERRLFRLGANFFFVFNIVGIKCLAGATFVVARTFFATAAMDQRDGKNKECEDHKGSDCFFHDESFNWLRISDDSKFNHEKQFAFTPWGDFILVFRESVGLL